MLVRIKLIVNRIEDGWLYLIEKYGEYWIIPAMISGMMGFCLHGYGHETLSKAFLFASMFIFAAFVSPATAPPPPQLGGDCSSEGIKKRKVQELSESRKELAAEREKLLTQLNKRRA